MIPGYQLGQKVKGQGHRATKYKTYLIRVAGVSLHSIEWPVHRRLAKICDYFFTARRIARQRGIAVVILCVTELKDSSRSQTVTSRPLSNGVVDYLRYECSS